MSEPDISEAPVPAPPPPAAAVWLRRLSSLLLIIFCFELGLFLLVYPWTAWWTENYFSTYLKQAWDNTYLRGAVSGVGMVNLWIALAEVFRMFSRK